MYQVIWGSPDNSDGIYYGKRLIISVYRLEYSGYDFDRVRYWSQKRLVELVYALT